MSLIILMIGTCVFASTSAVFALTCRGIIDAAVSVNKAGIIKYGLLLAGIILVQLILRLSIRSQEEFVQARLEISFRKKILSAVMSKEYKDVSKFHSGEILNRMFSDVNVVTSGVTGIVPSVFNMVTRIICAVVVLLVLEWRLTILFMVAGVSLFFVSRFFRGKIKHLHKEVQETEGRVRSFLQETVENILVIKAFGVDEKLKNEDSENQEEHFKARMRKRRVSIFANAGFNFIFQMGYLIALVWGAFGIFYGVMTFGTQTAILQLVNQIQAPFANLSAVLPKYYSMLASAERIMELENLPDEVETERRIEKSDFRELRVKDLSFSYGELSVLKDTSFTIKRGEAVSLTGISGGGKTTFFLLILGAYKQSKGEMLINGARDSFNPGIETRHIFSYVPQGNYLFSGTVAYNISFLEQGEEMDMEKVKKAAKIACVEDFINELPKGYDTKVGEKGFGVSEGQAQRIAIARAVYANSEIFLLDEATSALDEETEAKVLKNIASLEGKTLIVVTHRRAALEICDKHLYLKDGVISEE
ncbi:MAG: ABC transporter ATP-binding protein/permease [Lachnospiraceae bacterium]|nr:ABC transporter ATP-binding protein/permease [Lachnospiraceae bacterium]